MRMAVPSVTNVKRAQGIARTTHPSHRLLHSAAIAKAKGTLSDANPENMTGGWMTIHGSCGGGFRPWPSAGIWPRKRNGDCFTRIATIPMKEATYTIMTGGSCSFADRRTKSPMSEPQKSHRRKEPSCPAQNVEKR